MLRHRYVCVAHVHVCPCVCARLQDIIHFSQKQKRPCVLLFFVHLSWRLLQVSSDHPALLVVCALVAGVWVPGCMCQPPSWETSVLCSKHSFTERGSLHACSSLSTHKPGIGRKEPLEAGGLHRGTRPARLENCQLTAFQRVCPTPTPPTVSEQHPALLLTPGALRASHQGTHSHQRTRASIGLIFI